MVAALVEYSVAGLDQVAAAAVVLLREHQLEEANARVDALGNVAGGLSVQGVQSLCRERQQRGRGDFAGAFAASKRAAQLGGLQEPLRQRCARQSVVQELGWLIDTAQ